MVAEILIVGIVNTLTVTVMDSVLKTNPWIDKLKDLNGEKIMGSFL